MSIAGLLNQTITIKAKTGLNRYGRETVGAAITVSARFQSTTKTILLATGDSITLDGYIDVGASTVVATNDRITYNGNDYRVHSRKEAIGRNGHVHHITLGVALWQT